MNNLKTDYPCNLKPWLMYFFTVVFSKMLYKTLNLI